MTSDFRSLCAELAGWIERSTRHYIRDPDVLIRARAALADHVPDTRKMIQPPADGEVKEAVAWLREKATWCTADDTEGALFDRAADLLERMAGAVKQSLTTEPIPVSERLPESGDCDEWGRCWWWYPPVPRQNYGYWLHEDDATERALEEWPTHWLPDQSLPVPSEEEGGSTHAC